VKCTKIQGRVEWNLILPKLYLSKNSFFLQIWNVEKVLKLGMYWMFSQHKNTKNDTFVIRRVVSWSHFGVFFNVHLIISRVSSWKFKVKFPTGGLGSRPRQLSKTAPTFSATKSFTLIIAPKSSSARSTVRLWSGRKCLTLLKKLSPPKTVISSGEFRLFVHGPQR